MRRPARVALGVAAAVLAATALPLGPADAAATSSRRTYVVVTTAGSPAASLVGALGGTVRHRYAHALRGFSVSLPTSSVPALRALPGVVGVEVARVLRAQGAQGSPPSYGLDRVDQRGQPLDKRYRWAADGRGVTAYVIDSGIAYGHSDFGGRARPGFDAITKGGSAADCLGHGTHVAGTLGGASFGVAKRVSLVSVRVIGCDDTTTSDVAIAGIDWIIGHHAAGAPAVANMSIAGAGIDPALDAAVNRAVADGVVFVAAAGNDGGLVNDALGWSDACRNSPAHVPAALTVAATNPDDSRWVYSDRGSCVDLWAPGADIVSADYRSATAAVAMSGTSMASPHVAGTAALYLAGHRGASPAQVSQALVGAATPGVVTNAGSGTTTRLLYEAW